VAVASAGPYASLRLAPDRQPRQHPTTRFLQAGCPSCHPTNSVKALKALDGLVKPMIINPSAPRTAQARGLCFAVVFIHREAEKRGKISFVCIFLVLDRNW